LTKKIDYKGKKKPFGVTEENKNFV